jgi:cytoskeletal protein CcmA (bactofilin family)
MFNSKSKSTFEATDSNASTLISSGTTITGDIDCNGDIRIDGVLKGNLKGKAKIIIGTDGTVEGNINGLQADIMGRVTGNITVQELLYLHGNTKVHGDIYAGKLQVEPSAVFNGQCHMGANVVEINNGIANAVNQ